MGGGMALKNPWELAIPWDLATDVSGQLAWLRNHNVVIDEEDRAVNYLRSLGWYRFCSYLRPFEKTLQTDGASFEHVIQLCRFDHNLRLLILDAMERIEISLKNVLFRHLHDNYGPGWMHSSEWYRPEAFTVYRPEREPIHDHLGEEREAKEPEIARIQRALQHGMSRLRKRFNSQLLQQDGFAGLALLDELSFGMTSRIFAALKDEERWNITEANYQPLLDEKLAGWLRSLTVVRNTAAHHARLWNVRFARDIHMPPFVKQKHDRKGLEASRNIEKTMYGHCCAIFVLLNKSVTMTEWHFRLRELLEENHQAAFDLAETMGFPEQWHGLPFWRRRNWNHNRAVPRVRKTPGKKKEND